jgi:hypothetical protein
MKKISLSPKWTFEITPGSPMQLGATIMPEGINFAVFSRHAENLWLALYTPAGNGTFYFGPENMTCNTASGQRGRMIQQVKAIFLTKKLFCWTLMHGPLPVEKYGIGQVKKRQVLSAVASSLKTILTGKMTVPYKFLSKTQSFTKCMCGVLRSIPIPM